MKHVLIIALIVLLAPCHVYPYQKTISILSNGVKTGYQMQTLRLHKGTGVDSISGANDSMQHLYLDSHIDDDFFGVEFFESDGVTPITHRRMICQKGTSADFILKVDLPSAGQVKQIIVNFVASGRVTSSSDAALENILFYGWVRQGASRNGFLYNYWGVENTIIYDGGRFRAWFRGPSTAQSASDDYAYQGRLRYAESSDGLTWTDMGEATGHGHYEGQPYVYKDPSGTYHMMYSNNNNGYTNQYRYLTSPSGNNGTWTVVSESAFAAGGVPGNICFWREGTTWRVMWEWLQSGQWVTSYAYGSALTSLTKYNEGAPVVSGSNVGGMEVHSVGQTYYLFGHASENGGGTLPSSNSLYKSTDLINWTRVGWLTLRYYHATQPAQIADPTIQEVNGKTYLWYESQPDQADTNVPWLSLATFDQPLSRLLDSTITTAIHDDLAAEGWTFDSGYGENNTDTLSTVFRKLSDHPSAISQNCVVVKTESGRYLRIRKPIGTLSAENVFEFYARAEQTNKKFEAFRIDKDGSNGVLAGVYFDTDGNIKYYNGTTPTSAGGYSASTYYRFQVSQKARSWDLAINGVTIATNIPYYSAAAAPAYFYIGQDSAATGYISGLYTRQYSSAATTPVWQLANTSTLAAAKANMKAAFR